MPRTPQINRLVNLRKRLESEYNNKLYVDTLKIKKTKNRLTHVDLFSGAGGNIEGMRQAGFDTLLSIEIDPDASNTIKKNFPTVNHIEGNICDVHESTVRKIVGKKPIDVLSAGFPCQGFSIAGFQHIDDKRNILYKQVVRMVRTLNPKYVVMENVPGIVNMNDGNFVRDIRKLFARYGYPEMSVLILESASYGIAQIRPRTIFIANRLGKNNPYPKPILQPDEFIPIESAIRDLERRSRNSKTNHEWTEHRPNMIRRCRRYLVNHFTRHIWICCKKTILWNSDHSHSTIIFPVFVILNSKYSVAFNIAKIGFGMRHILLYDPSLFLLLLKLTLKLSAFFAHRVMRVIRQLLI